jgi:hypothetical protein
MNPTERAQKLQTLLGIHLNDLEEAHKTLLYSFEKCRLFGKKESYSPQELESFEALASRFARIADMLVQKIFRSLFRLLKETPQGVIDHINLAEKMGVCASAADLLLIRELRNEISHEYSKRALTDLFQDLLIHTPTLLDASRQAVQFAKTRFPL